MAISILFEPAERDVAKALAALLVTELPTDFQPQLLESALPSDAEWNRVVLVLYGRDGFSPGQAARLATLRPGGADGSPDRGLVIPVSLMGGANQPPAPFAELKSAPYQLEGGGFNYAILQRIKSFVGLTLTKGEAKIFVSYRASDGNKIAQQLYDRLRSEGYIAWLDEAQDHLMPGDIVPKTINDAIKSAGMIVLVDTVDVRQSYWVSQEIDTANANLLPVLPVVVGELLPRFNALLSLRRWVNVSLPQVGHGLSNQDVQQVLVEVERYLLEIYERRNRLEALARDAFSERQFTWEPESNDARIRLSQRGGQPPVKVLSHCSPFDVRFEGALRAFEAIVRAPRNFQPQHRLYIYDGNVLEHNEKRLFFDQQSFSFTPVHHAELGLLIDGHFSFPS